MSNRFRPQRAQHIKNDFFFLFLLYRGRDKSGSTIFSSLRGATKTTSKHIFFTKTNNRYSYWEQTSPSPSRKLKSSQPISQRPTPKAIPTLTQAHPHPTSRDKAHWHPSNKQTSLGVSKTQVDQSKRAPSSTPPLPPRPPAGHGGGYSTVLGGRLAIASLITSRHALRSRYILLAQWNRRRSNTLARTVSSHTSPSSASRAETDFLSVRFA